MPSAHEPTDDTRRTVRILKSCANSHKTIALILGIDEKTLMKRYREELDYGLEHTRGLVSAAVVRQALQGNINAAKFYLACFGGPEWKAPKEADDSNGNGATIIIRGGIASVQHESDDSSS